MPLSTRTLRKLPIFVIFVSDHTGYVIAKLFSAQVKQLLETLKLPLIYFQVLALSFTGWTKKLWSVYVTSVKELWL